jgi:hypothetical protein
MYNYLTFSREKCRHRYALKSHENAFQIVVIVKDLGSDSELDPKLIASQVGSGSKTQRKMGSG